MTSVPDYSEAVDLLEPMRQSHPHLCDANELAFRRERIVTNLRQQVMAVPAMRRQVRRNVFASSTVFAAAAGAALWFGLHGIDTVTEVTTDGPAVSDPSCLLASVSGQVVRTRGEEVLIIGDGQRLQANDTLRTMEGSSASVTTPQGVAVSLDSASQVQYLGRTVQSEQLRLVAGQVNARVPKLGKQRSFSVVTPDAVVTVHGTEFSVNVQNKKSCVRVTEGLVAVHARGETAWLSAGASWGCEAPVATAEVSDLPPAPVRSARKVSMPRERNVETGVNTPTSSLLEQNRLFQRALREQKRGNANEARRLFKQYLARYPEAALAGQAREQLNKLE